MAVAATVAERLRARGETVAIGESSSGGLIAAALLAQPGASAIFAGGGVIYNRAAMVALAGFSPAEAQAVRSASEPYAAELAARMRQRLGATWGLAETGAAGPTGNRSGDAPGHCCCAVSGPLDRAQTIETGSADRPENMRSFALAALVFMQAQLDLAGPPGTVAPETRPGEAAP